MNKIWQISPVIQQAVIDKHPDFNPVVLQLLFNRNLDSQQAITSFFSNDFVLPDPFLFKNMKQACELIIGEIKQGHQIAIIGDYDADGVTASAILKEALNILKTEVKIWIPSRAGEGYGMNKRIIDEIVTAGCQLIITVDNGIKSQEEVAYAKSKGLSVIITDHHTLPEADKLPDCLIINPIDEEEKYSFKYLCGAGVAFKLVSAIISLAKLEQKTKDKILNKVLDLTAIGTIADCVSLTGENRNLVKLGLKQINNQPRLGVKELMRVAQIKLPLNEWNIGWQIVPRLNVAGRLDHANTAYQLLLTKDKLEAKELAESLNQKNIDRQNITKQIVKYCQTVVEAEMKDEKILILVSPDINDSTQEGWIEGVIGLVAGRLTEKYGKPTIVICLSQGQIKGSARSVEQFNMVALLDQVKDCLDRYGGHKMAAGFSLKPERLKEFSSAVREIAKIELKEIPTAKIKIEAELTLDQIDDNLLNKLEDFAPFGQHNPEPIFASYQVLIDDLRAMGASGQHLKLTFGHIEAVAFNIKPEWQKLKINDKINVAYTLSWNFFNNKQSIQLKIIDIQLN